MWRNPERVADIADANPHLKQDLQRQRLYREVEIAPLERFKAAVEAHSALKWDERMIKFAGATGAVMEVDQSDSTARVKFGQFRSFAWLPTCILRDCDEEEEDSSTDDELDLESPGRAVRLPLIDTLKPAVEKHPGLEWFDALVNACGQRGRVLCDNSDGTSQVEFSKEDVAPEGMVAWMPTDLLIEIEENNTDGVESGDAAKIDDVEGCGSVDTGAVKADGMTNCEETEPAAKRQRT